MLFLQAVVKRGRQRLFGDMASQYLALVDIKLDRVRARVTVARAVDEKLPEEDRPGSHQGDRQAGAARFRSGAGHPGRGTSSG